MIKEEFIDSHLGARELEIENVRLMIPNIGNIKDLIDDFRKNAKNSLKSNGYEKDLKELSYEKYDNFISILGNRGLGKTSIMLTTIQQIKNEQYYFENDNKQHHCPDKEPYCPDLLSPLIVPDEMSEISDNLGWIIVILEDIYYHQIKCYIKQSCLLNQDNKVSEYEIKLQKYLQELKENYHHRKEAYKNIVDNRYESNTEYIDKASKIQKQDLAIVNSFKKFVDAMINYKRYVNLLHNCYKEPLIFFFFDDVDMTACNCESIFEDFLTFLSNPHIVTFISGDYDLFLQSVTLKMLEKEKMYHWNIDDIYIFGKTDDKYKVVEMAKSRSEFFLKKVLPPLYRFEIQLLNNKRKSQLTYAHHYSDVDSLLRKKINELLSDVYLYHDNNDNKDEINENTEHKNVVENKEKNDNKNANEQTNSKDDNDNNKDNKAKEENSDEQVKDFFVKDGKITIYPYYAVFSCNVRGFINVYLFLYREAKRRHQEKCQKTEVECVNFIREFLEIILNSKNTYRKNLEDISRFLYIKDYEVNKDNAFSLLRIDCEELNEVVIEKINENNKICEKLYPHQKPYILEDYKNEIEALIMLPLFMNELQYAFFKKNYKTRYKRIQKKLKNILVNVFVSKFNPYMEMMVPDKADIADILLFYSFVTTRMSMTTIRAINGNRSDYTMKQNDLYKMNNDKKYFVQIFKAICEICNGEQIRPGKSQELLSVSRYNQICYDNLNERNAYEKEIAKVLIKKYQNIDYQWLVCLFEMIQKNISSVNELYPYDQYFDKFIYPVLQKLTTVLPEIYKTEIMMVVHFLEELELVFSINHIIFYKSDNHMINQFIIEGIEMFIEEYENISLDTNNKEKYNKLIDRFRKQTKELISQKTKTFINDFSNYTFEEQKTYYSQHIHSLLSTLKRNIENKEEKCFSDTIEELYRTTKKVYDCYLYTFNNYVHFNALDIVNIERNLINDIYKMLNIDERDDDFKFEIHQLLTMIYNDEQDETYKEMLKKSIKDSIDRLVDNEQSGQFIYDDLIVRINVLEKSMNSDGFNQRELIAYAKVVLYITPIFVLCLYMYDLRNGDNMERDFFLNLLDVFNQYLDNGQL